MDEGGCAGHAEGRYHWLLGTCCAETREGNHDSKQQFLSLRPFAMKPRSQRNAAAKNIMILCKDKHRPGGDSYKGEDRNFKRGAEDKAGSKVQRLRHSIVIAIQARIIDASPFLHLHAH